jgi:hypothetical protein
MLFHDRAQLDGPARITRDGYLVADALVAKGDNIQDYFPAEIGQPPKADGTPYRIGRQSSEVFSDEDVTAANWRALGVGDIGGDIKQQGKFLRVPVKMMDAAAITKARTTHREFSLGYSADLDMTPGKIGDADVDGFMRNIRINHLAIVPTARGGPELRIIDERPAHLHDHQETGPMPKIKIGDAEVDPTNGEAVTVAVQALDAKVITLASQNTTLAKDLGDEKAKVATLETEKATLTQQLADAKITPEKLRDAAKSYSQVVGKAKALGVAITDAMDEPAIMKTVVDAKMGDAAKDWNAEQVAASFAVLTKDAKIEDAKPGLSGSPRVLTDGATAVANARAGWLAEKQNAHRAQPAS